jgi:heme exporter protein D
MSQFFVYLFLAARDFVKYVWPAVGPLVGVLVGAYIANRNQRRHWLADSKREEYREILAVMNKTAGAIANADFSATSAIDFRELVEVHPELLTGVMEILGTRIFITRTLEKMKFQKRFVSACTNLGGGSGLGPFIEVIDQLCKELRDAALIDVGM